MLNTKEIERETLDVANKELSGSPAINPSPRSIKVKDRAVHVKKVSALKVRDVIGNSNNNPTRPLATDIGNHINGMRRNI